MNPSIVDDVIVPILKSNNLSEQQFDSWMTILPHLSIHELEELTKLLQTDKDSCLQLTQNIADKVRALTDSDLTQWQVALDGDVTLINTK